jgi:hypothetical protein
MEICSEYCFEIFATAIKKYHLFDNVNALIENPYPDNSLNNLLYEKNWIDTVQWHLEDLIRDPAIDAYYALSVKRRIDKLNQQRTDRVEGIDDFFVQKYKSSVHRKNARFNSETLGWALDRLSILALKEFHINAELERRDASVLHLQNCELRRKTIGEQKKDLLQSINWLMQDLEKGKIIFKTYRQLKMYNDAAFNPVLYQREAQLARNEKTHE